MRPRKRSRPACVDYGQSTARLTRPRRTGLSRTRRSLLRLRCQDRNEGLLRYLDLADLLFSSGYPQPSPPVHRRLESGLSRIQSRGSATACFAGSIGTLGSRTARPFFPPAKGMPAGRQIDRCTSDEDERGQVLPTQHCVPLNIVCPSTSNPHSDLVGHHCPKICQRGHVNECERRPPPTVRLLAYHRERGGSSHKAA